MQGTRLVLPLELLLKVPVAQIAGCKVHGLHGRDENEKVGPETADRRVTRRWRGSMPLRSPCRKNSAAR